MGTSCVIQASPGRSSREMLQTGSLICTPDGTVVFINFVNLEFCFKRTDLFPFLYDVFVFAYACAPRVQVPAGPGRGRQVYWSWMELQAVVRCSVSGPGTEL